MSPKLLQNQLPITHVVSIFEDNTHFLKNVKYAKAENVGSDFNFLDGTDDDKIGLFTFKYLFVSLIK